MVDDPVEDDYDDGEEPVPPIPAAYDPIRVIMPEVLAVLHASLGSIELRTLCLSFLRSLSTVMDHKPKIAVELPSIMAALSRQGGTTPPPPPSRKSLLRSSRPPARRYLLCVVSLCR
jgi:hypothetical protein